MIARILPPEEWPRLIGTEVETVWPHLDPTRAHVLVVEDGAEIVGTWVLMNVVHAECLWIAPRYRQGVSVARRLWTFMQRTARDMGAPVVATAAMTTDVKKLLEHVGATELQGAHYSMRVH